MPKAPGNYAVFLFTSAVSSGFKHKHEACTGLQDENKPRRKLINLKRTETRHYLFSSVSELAGLADTDETHCRIYM